MYKKRITNLSIVFACLGLLLFCGICLRMIIQRETISEKTFVQQSELEKIRTIADQGLISRDEQGEIHIDYPAIEQEHGRKIASFIRKREQYLSWPAKGKLVIDLNAVKVTSRQSVSKGALARRGRILDRRGRTLAETVRRENGQWRRLYPYGAAALPVIGAVHPLFGERNLEKQLAPWLIGKKSSGGVAALYRFLSGRDKIGDVHLTLDGEVQKAAYQSLGDQTGAIVVVDVRTGAIIAAASTPSFDPGTGNDADWKEAARQGYRSPFVNRGLKRRYPPGSTFKIITATAVIDKKGFNPKKAVLRCRGVHPKYGIHDYGNKRHGWVNLRDAFKLSCNVYFGEAGVRLGPDLLQKAELFGFNHAWKLFAPGKKPETVPSLAFAGKKSVQGGGRWQPADFKHNPKLVAQGGIGQNVITATPLQMALAGAAIANRGSLMQPFLVNRITFASGNKDGEEGLVDWYHTRPQEYARVCRKKSADAILDMMKLVMYRGTGYRLPKLYRVHGKYKLFAVARKNEKNLLAGKTGTAETGTSRGDHSWFVAVAPVDNPRYAVAALVEYGGLGAKKAGRAAVKTMLAALNSE